MNFGSLFTGIGGFDLGFEQAGLTCEWQVEIDKDCRKVLANRFPNVSRYRDVKEIGKLPTVDVICGGFPCQDLSVAGKRAGLAGERSGLWFEFLRIVELNQPRRVVIENVPGLLSSDEGRDFAVILRGLVNVGYCLAWRVVDAQYYRVAQRRRRVFIVGSLGNGSCAEILFESESVSWNPPTRGEAGERIANAISGGAHAGGHNGQDDLSVIPVAISLSSGSAISRGVSRPGRRREDDVNIVARPLAFNQTQNHYDESQQTYVTHTLRSEGADAGEDGTGRGTPLVVAFSENQRGEVRTSSVSPQLSCSGGKPGSGYPAIAFSAGQGSKARSAAVSMDHTPPLKAAESGSNQVPSVSGNFGVRRLTPRECERLQGFPDDWTLYDADGKEISDSARYRMLGNAVAVPCAKWIGDRLLRYFN